MRLRALGPGWHVLDDVALGDGLEVDHLVIGAPGTFLVTSFAKRSPLPRRPIDRARLQSVVRVAVHEARVVSRRLSRLVGESISAWPVVVTNDGILDVTKAAGDAYVVAEQLLIPWLKSLMPVLDAEVVDAVVERASAPETWAVGA